MTPNMMTEPSSLASAAAIPNRRRVLTPYLAAWGLIGLLATAYLAALAMRPDLVNEHLPAFRPAEPEGNQGNRAMSKALAEVQGLRQSVSQVQLDVAKLKTDLASDAQRSTALNARIAALEEQVASATTVAGAAPVRPLSQVAPTTTQSATQPAKFAPAQDTASQGGEAPRIETGSIAAPAATVLPKVINAPQQQQPQQATVQKLAATAAAVPTAKPMAAPKVETDPDMAELVTFGPAVVKPTPDPVGLKISNSPSLDALRLSWNLLADRHSAQLRNLEARYLIRAPEGDKDASFDLIAGPIKTQAEAKRLCKALAAKNIPCQVGTFGGNQL